MDEIPVISLAGQVLDTSFIARNQGKSLVYLIRKPFLERYWALYINKKLWFYELKNSNNIFTNINQLNFSLTYSNFNWLIINSYNIKYMHFLKNKFTYNYIFDLKLLSLLSLNNNNLDKNPLHIIGLKNKIKNIILLSKGSIALFKLLKINLSKKLVKSFFYNTLKLKNERVYDNFFGNSKLKKNYYNLSNKKYNYKKRLNKKKIKKIFHFKIYRLFDKLNFYNKILNLNLVFKLGNKLKGKLKNHIKDKPSIKAWFIIFRMLNLMGSYDCNIAQMNKITKYKNRKHVKKLLLVLFNYAKKGQLDWILYDISRLLVKKGQKFRAYSRTFNKWALQSTYKKKNYNKWVNLEKIKQNNLFKPYNSLNLNININKVRTFQKFHFKTYLKPYFKPIGKKYFKRRQLTYIKRYKSKFLWGQVDQIYKFTNNKRMVPKLIVNGAQELKSSGARLLGGNLFKYHRLWKYKKYIYLVTLYLSIIITYLLRNCIFKLFLFSHNNKFICDIELLLHKFICIFYSKIIKKKKQLNKNFKKLARYYLRSFSLNNNYIFI